jgi:Lsr2
MATDLIVVISCDIHGRGTEAARTVLVGLDGNWREVDLCADCLDPLVQELTPVMRAGRVPLDEPKQVNSKHGLAQNAKSKPLVSSAGPGSGARMAEGRRRNKAIRAWAAEHAEELGHPEWLDVEPGGYMPRELRKAWEQAMLAEQESRRKPAAKSA